VRKGPSLIAGRSSPGVQKALANVRRIPSPAEKAYSWLNGRPAPASGRRMHVTHARENPMNEETFNLSIRKFLKMVGVSSQRDIEQAVARAIAEKRIAGTETFPAHVTLEIAGLALRVKFDGEIRLG
jgi:hypothetical protein